MRKSELLETANQGRDITAPPLVNATKKQLEQHIHDNETQAGIAAPKSTPPTTAALFKRLNATRVKNGDAPLKAWKDSRDKLEKAIVTAELKSKSIAPIKPVAPAIAEGANTSKFNTKLHTNKLEEAVKKMDKREESNKSKLQKTYAKKLAATHQLNRRLLLECFIAKNWSGAPDDWEMQFRKFLADRKEAGLTSRKPREKTPETKWAEAAMDKFQCSFKDALRYAQSKGINKD